MMLFKNNVNNTLDKYKLDIILRELKFTLYSIIFEAFNFKYFMEAIKLRDKMRIKREKIEKITKINDITLESVKLI